MTDYEKICDFENLYKAHCISRRGKRGKEEVIHFEMNLAENLWNMKRQLESHTYEMLGYYSFVIYEPKKRRVFAAHYQDRVLQHCICDEVLCPQLQKRLIYDNAACQLNKGTHFAIMRVSHFLHEYYKKHGAQGYVLKCDVHKYFDSINHDVLKKKLKKSIVDKDVRELLGIIIDSYETKENTGLPLGNQTSQWFAIYYLDTVDRLVKEKLRIKYYSRYMDDWILIHESKQKLQECLSIIRKVVEDELKLELNQKTQIFPIKNGIEYLGYHMYLTETGKVIRKLKTSSKKRMKRHLKKMQKDYAEGKIDLKDVNQSLAGYYGHLQHGHTYKLKKSIFSQFVLRRNPTSDQMELPEEDIPREQNLLPEGMTEEEYKRMKLREEREYEKLISRMRKECPMVNQFPTREDILGEKKTDDIQQNA